MAFICKGKGHASPVWKGIKPYKVRMIKVDMHFTGYSNGLRIMRTVNAHR